MPPSSSTVISTSRRLLSLSNPALFRRYPGPAASAASSTRAFASFSSAFDYQPPSSLSLPSSHFVPRSPRQRTYAIGDVHGDLRALVSALSISGLIAPPAPGSSVSKVQWTGGDSVLVQVGDVLDRGAYECACLSLLASLSRQAKEKGGGVVLCLGNHEVLNALGMFHYAERDGNVEFEEVFGDFFNREFAGDRWRLHYAGNQPSRWRACEPGGTFSSTFALLSNFVLGAQVGRSVFVHGGLTSAHLRDGGGLSGLNASARGWFKGAGYTPSVADKSSWTSDEIIGCAQNRADSFSASLPPFLGGGPKSEHSPVWMRDYSFPEDRPPRNKSVKALLQSMLSDVGNGAQRLVVGHTVQRQINSACDGLVWRVDVGMSDGVMGGDVEVLEIVHGETEDEIYIVSAMGERVLAAERSARNFKSDRMG